MIRYGRDAKCRVWRGPEDPDLSDDEWEQDFTAKLACGSQQLPLERDNGLQLRTMVQHLYQQVEEVAASEDHLNEITMTALQVVDNITGINQEGDETSGNPNPSLTGDQDNEDGHNANFGTGGDPDMAGGSNPLPADDVDRVNNDKGNYPSTASQDWRHDAIYDSLETERAKDAKALEEAMQLLNTGSSTMNLGAAVMLVNLVATHPGITDRAADDLFATVRSLLPLDNTLPVSSYQAKTLTRRLGLDFKNIDGCPSGCVLFDEEGREDLDRCPVCNCPQYRDMLWRTKPLKVMRFFPVTPRLQRFY